MTNIHNIIETIKLKNLTIVENEKAIKGMITQKKKILVVDDE